MNLMQAIWNQFDAISLANCLVDAGIINNLIRILTEYSMVNHYFQLGSITVLFCFHKNDSEPFFSEKQ